MILDNIWIINLDKSTDRMNKIKNNLDSLKLNYNRFSAINGKNISQEYLDNNVSNICKNFLCNYGIIGCASSHRKLWEQLVNSDVNAYLILEDDALLDEKSIDIIKKLEPKIEEFSIDFLNLHCYNIGCNISKGLDFSIDNYNFGKPLFPLYTTGYIITKNGAKILLENIKKISYHVDFEIAINYLYNKLNYYTSDKSIITSYTGETTIGTKSNSLSVKLINDIGLKYPAWVLNIPLLTINLYYEINFLTIILLILLLLNIFKINNKILYWFIFLELFLINSIYFHNF